MPKNFKSERTRDLLLNLGKHSLRYMLILGMALAVPQAVAIVSMEDVHLGEPREGFSGKFEFSASGASGNTEKYDLGLGTRLQWHKDKHTNIAVFNYSFARSQGQTTTDKGFIHLRHIYQKTEKIAWEGFVQSQKNELTRLRLRNLLGFGARFGLSKVKDKKAVVVGAGAFYETEQLEPLVVGGAIEESDVWRGNFYFVAKYSFRNGAEFLSSTYYQPSLEQGGDFRLRETASVSFKLSKKTAFRFSLDMTYDSEPPMNVKKTDTVYRTGFEYAF